MITGRFLVFDTEEAALARSVRAGKQVAILNGDESDAGAIWPITEREDGKFIVEVLNKSVLDGDEWDELSD